MFKVNFTAPGIESTLLSAEVILDYIMTTCSKGCTQAQVEQDTYTKGVQKAALLVKFILTDGCKRTEDSSPHNQQAASIRHSFFSQPAWPLKIAFCYYLKKRCLSCSSAFSCTTSVLSISSQLFRMKYKHSCDILLTNWVTSFKLEYQGNVEKDRIFCSTNARSSKETCL